MKKIIIIMVAIIVAFLVLKGILDFYNHKSTTDTLDSISNEKSSSSGLHNENKLDTKLSSMEINAFNMMFAAYEGTQKGTSVKSLISNIDDSNSEYKGEREISVKFSGNAYKSSSELSNLSNLIETSSSYDISLEYGSNQLITIINIEEK